MGGRSGWRWVRAGVAWLLVGALLNTAVAAAIGVWDHGWQRCELLGISTPVVGGERWVCARTGAAGLRVVSTAAPGTALIAPYREGVRVAAAWDEVFLASFAGSTAEGQTRIEHLTRDAGAEERRVIAHVRDVQVRMESRMAAGWPIPSLEGAYLWGEGMTPEPWWTLEFDTATDAMGRVWSRVVLLRPHPVGMPAGSAFYGLLGLTAVRTGAAARRWRRRRCGRCPWCGYDLRASVGRGCPECGGKGRAR